LILLPYFNGERTPALPNAKATLTGITGRNMNKNTICRAALEGATFGLRYGLDVIRRCNISPSQIRLVGGGSKSSLWQQMVADIFNCEVICPQQEEAGAFGAALQAVWCSLNYQGQETSIQDITERYVILNEQSRRIPDSANSTHYNQIYEKYLACNNALVETY
jgi:xylulokinase